MKSLLTLVLVTVVSIVNGQGVSGENDPTKHPTSVNRNFVNTINGKPIAFYLNHKSIDTPAKLFYQGKYALYDDDQTFAFLDSLLTNNEETRPFYFFIFNQALRLSDGALSEFMSGICRQYPCEFLKYFDNKVYKLDKEKWTGFIGFDVNDKVSFEKLVTRIDQIVRTNCSKRKLIWDKVKIRIEEKLEFK